jgi:hypothetical protein
MKRDYVFCIWCGTTGGFANGLIIKGSGDNAIVECRWCSLGVNVLSSVKEK